MIETDVTTASIARVEDSHVQDALAEAATLARAGRLPAAIARLQPLADAAPDRWLPCSALVDLHEAGGAHALALEALHAHLDRNPACGDAWFRLAGLLHRTGHACDAFAAARNAVALQPDSPKALNLFGCLGDRDDPATSDAFARAIALAPGWNLPRRNLAGILRAQGESGRAIDLLREAIAHDANDRIAWTALAETLLEQGDDAGWDAYEWRFGHGGVAPPFPGTVAPMWDGGPLHGRVVMVWLEQGLGDQLQFCRYLHGIVAAGGRAWLQTPRKLRGLLESLGVVERFFDEGESPTGYDYQIPLMSLPRVLRKSRPGIPPSPYLHASATLSTDAVALLDAPAGMKRIGLVHASRPDHPSAMQRDCPLPLFQTLAEIPGVRLYDLQFSAAPDTPDWLTGIGHAVGDFAHTAAVVDALDLVITVDTAMAHLCGALGVPVWTLLSTPCDWRWRRDREDTPWYPSMRLYRQARTGDWSAPLARVARDLAEFATASRPS